MGARGFTFPRTNSPNILPSDLSEMPMLGSRGHNWPNFGPNSRRSEPGLKGRFWRRLSCGRKPACYGRCWNGTELI